MDTRDPTGIDVKKGGLICTNRDHYKKVRRVATRTRNYRKEYYYHSKPAQKKRKHLTANRKLKPSKGKEVHHKNGNPRDNGVAI